MVKAIWPWPRVKFDPSMAEKRLKICRQCDFYVPEYKTCGSPDSEADWFNPVTQQNEPVGCFCFMPYKARIPGATCWASDVSAGTMGWEAEL